MGSWVEDETAGCDLGDERLNRRLGVMLTALGERPRKSLPTAFQDWANTKAAYRFFANANVSDDKILAGHFAASALRVQATDGPILILQDTTEFSFKRAEPEKIGFTKTSCGRKTKEGRHHQHTICGMLMHASLADFVIGFEAAQTSPDGQTCGQLKGPENAYDPVVVGAGVGFQSRDGGQVHGRSKGLSPGADRAGRSRGNLHWRTGAAFCDPG